MSETHIFDPSILREYDIRGVVGETLNEKDAYFLGRAYGTFVRNRGGARVCLGYDGRHSSPALCEALQKGLVDTGLHVQNIGLGPSPMLYFAVKSTGADAGIMITGSHNPSAYNGFKMLLQDAPVYGALIQELGQIAASGIFQNEPGRIETLDLQEPYVDRVFSDYTGDRPLTVAWDAGNGAAGDVLRRLTEKLPGEHIVLYGDIDGDFPNHHPDPTVDKNLKDLQKTVLEHGCDLGIAFDGDGDRIGVVDERGTILRCDVLMALYAAEILSAKPGVPIIGDIKCSQVMFDEIARLGGQPVMWKTGHSLVKAKMAELNAPLAGELSGHIFFADKYYGYDDALYCAVRLLNLVAAADGGLSSLTAHLPVLHNTPEVRFDVDEAEKFALVDRVYKNLQGQDGLNLSDIDGVRVATDDGWWLLRASNTQNALVTRAESDTADGLKRLKDMVTQQVQAIGYDVTF